MTHKDSRKLPVILAACDEVYFRRHALGFCKSAIAAGHDVCVLVSPTPGSSHLRHSAMLETRLFPRFKSNFTGAELRHLTLNCVCDERTTRCYDRRSVTVYFQSLRFFFLPDLLRKWKRPVLLLDIDSVVRAPVQPPLQADLGLFLRLGNQKGDNEYDRLGMKIAAGAVYATPSSVTFFNKVVEYLDRNELRYFADQRALFEIYKSEKQLRIVDLAGLGWLDWNFNQSSAIWTGKGKRNRRDPRFIRERFLHEGRGRISTALHLLGYRLRLIKA